MSEAVAQLLATFEPLEPQEQHELLMELLRPCGELPETFLTDDDLVGLADDLFQALDAEESEGRQSNAKRGLVGGCGQGRQGPAMPGLGCFCRQ